MSLVMGVLSVAMSVLSYIKKKTGCEPELIRKALHVLMGFVTLSFPFLFSESWPVVALSVVTAVILSLVGRIDALNSWRCVLKADGRKSYGHICFPVGIGILFTLTLGQPLFFCIPVLILTLADAVSALVGIRYGAHKYNTVDGTKSTEGSLAFFAFALMGTLIPLDLFTSLPAETILCISFIMGILAMLFEGIAWRGFDNIAIPLGAFLVLQTHIGLPTGELATRLLMLAIILSFSIAWRHRTTLTGSAILGVALFSYSSFVVGGLPWMTMPLIVFSCYRWCMPARFQTLENRHSMYAILSVASTGLIWLCSSHYSDKPEFLYLYTLTFAVHAAIIMVAHVHSRGLNSSRLLILLNGTIRSWMLLFVPFLILAGFSRQAMLLTVVAPLCIALPVLAFYFSQQDPARSLTGKTRWFKQAVFAILGSLIGSLPLAFIH
jgi:phytol kinase